jgi:hypothetical protein
MPRLPPSVESRERGGSLVSWFRVVRILIEVAVLAAFCLWLGSILGRGATVNLPTQIAFSGCVSGLLLILALELAETSKKA